MNATDAPAEQKSLSPDGNTYIYIFQKTQQDSSAGSGFLKFQV